MIRKYSLSNRFSVRDLYVNLSRSRVSRIEDWRRMYLVINTAKCRRLMNTDPEIRALRKAA